MRVGRRFGGVALGLAALAVLLSAGARGGAAPITWVVSPSPSMSNITGDTDVDTKGTLVGAFNIGAPGVMGTPVNGVPFMALAFPGPTPVSDPSGKFTFDTDPQRGFQSSNNVGSMSAPFNGLSTNYQTLLSTIGGTLTEGAQPFTLTMSGLKVGHQYEFQWWNSASNPGNFPGLFIGSTEAMDALGNGVTLNSNPSGNGGGLGQFALGTFTADATSEVLTFNQASGFAAALNGLQLRDVTPAAPPPAVPEPSSLALVGVGGLALAAWRRRRKRR